MKILKGNYGECRFIDNMDETYGLPSLEEKSWDISFADPPYNKKLRGIGTITIRGKKQNQMNPNAIYYKDNLKPKDYKQLCTIWFNHLERITKGQFIHCGKRNINMWVSIKPPRDFLFHYSNNSLVNGSSSWRLTLSPILTYGKHNKINSDLIETSVKSGFLREFNLNHPCSLDTEFLTIFISQLKPQSIIDPFLGSGTIAEICEHLGIKWLGYEIDLENKYWIDIEKRIKRGIQKHKNYKNIKKTSQTKLL